MSSVVLKADNLRARLDRLPASRTVIRALVLLQLAWIIEGLDIGVSGPVLLTLKEVWRLSPAELGLLGSVGTLGIVIGLLPAGYLADRFGRKPVTVWGLFQFTLFTGLTALAPSYGWLMVLRFVNGLGQGVLFAVPYIMISELMRPTRRATIVGLENGFLELAYLIPALLGAWATSHFAHEWSWRIILLAAATPIFYAPIVAIWLPESPRWLIRRGKFERAENFVERLEDESGLPHDLTLLTGEANKLSAKENLPLGLYFSRPILLRSAIAYSSYAGGTLLWYGILTYGPIIFRSAGFTAVNAILMLGFMMFFGSFGNFLNGYLADRWGRKPTLALYAFAGATALAGLSYVHFPVLVVLIGAIVAFFGLGIFPTQKIYIAEQYPTVLRGFGTSTGEAVSRFLSGVVAAYFVPTILAVGGTSAVFLAIAGALTLLVLPALMFGRETANIDIDVVGDVKPERDVSSYPVPARLPPN
jgi:putative MFS transporter